MADTFIYSGSKIPLGGEIGQVLTKVGGPNYYTAWRTLQVSDFGLGTIATQNANNVAITGGTIDGVIFDDGVYQNEQN